MAVPMHPAAPEHLPSFITPPGETDILIVVTAAILAGAILMFGLLFLRLHHLPEQMAHRSKKAQIEIVSVLCLVALLTHIHAFWIVALLLAFIDIPDFPGYLGRITGAVERMVGREPDPSAAQATRREATPAAPPIVPAASSLSPASPSDAKRRPGKQREPAHA
jgi:hypothetical protein